MIYNIKSLLNVINLAPGFYAFVHFYHTVNCKGRTGKLYILITTQRTRGQNHILQFVACLKNISLIRCFSEI